MDDAPNYAPGTPLWVDLSTPDVQASARFYGELFGWDAEDLGEQAGHYHMFRKNGKMVAAAGPQADPQQPPAWSTYVATSNATETAQKVREAGGRIIVEPMDVMDQGRMAVFQDPTGAFFSVWQPDKHRGAELANAPGSFTWNELSTRDMDAAKAFYTRVFSWGVKDNEMAPGMSYTEWQVNGRSVAGGMPMPPNMPADVPPHWLVYFAVDDVDSAVDRVQQLGGRVMMPAMDSPAGRFAVVSDPHGAVFAVIKLSPRMDGSA
ncbi:MAG: VOC family protein [Chloroflexota bacterium]|nr:VOC family protein [Chloroflexota bacterium]